MTSMQTFDTSAIRHTAIMLLALTLVGCSSVVKQPPAPSTSANISPVQPTLPPAGSGRGGYYLDDGPGENTPTGLEKVPDAEPRVEPLLPRANRPYSVFGSTYTPVALNHPYSQRGVGSWYGKKFHGRKTSSGELYDMYKMTAAHPTLPIPSYSRVTNLDNGKQIIVRINDRGPFRSNRIIDLSYTAALKLGYLGKGSGMLQVEHLRPAEIERIIQSRRMSGITDEAIAPAQPQQASANDYPPLPSGLGNDDMRVPQPVATSLTGYYLQLGSFAKEHNAQAMHAQYAITWADKLPPAQIVQKGELYRLYAGPFSSRNEADTAARQMQNSGSPKPLIVEH
ncbi:MAG: septal ring lytic transglycosylase RlpA family protein [Burkholderiaceae bacterium]|nr:septal ring lytic transglycosylase RlpA family protein [Burkholderiaceae bacterium]